MSWKQKQSLLHLRKQRLRDPRNAYVVGGEGSPHLFGTRHCVLEQLEQQDEVDDTVECSPMSYEGSRGQMQQQQLHSHGLHANGSQVDGCRGEGSMEVGSLQRMGHDLDVDQMQKQRIQTDLLWVRDFHSSEKPNPFSPVETRG